MSGYTPLFQSLTTGSLCGKWPDIGLWALVLSLAGKTGLVDVTPDYLSRVTGLPLQEVVACMARFCAPDPYSRTTTDEGRRLTLIDPENRAWGWRVVNHGLYRERARKAAYDAERTASGRDAERKRTQRHASRDVPTSPAMSRSQTQTQTQTQQEGEARASARPARTAMRLPEDWELTPERRQVAVSEGVDPERTFAKFLDHWRAEGGQKARKADWDATWRNWCRREPEHTRSARTGVTARGPTAEDSERENLRQLTARRAKIGLAGFRSPSPGETADQYRRAQNEAWDRLQQECIERSLPAPPVSPMPPGRPVRNAVANLLAAKKVS